MQRKENRQEEVNGYNLFNEVKDLAVRSKNRGIVLCNIIEDYSKEVDGVKKVTKVVVRITEEYMECIPKNERGLVYEFLIDELKNRGWDLD